MIYKINATLVKKGNDCKNVNEGHFVIFPEEDGPGQHCKRKETAGKVLRKWMCAERTLQGVEVPPVHDVYRLLRGRQDFHQTLPFPEKTIELASLEESV